MFKNAYNASKSFVRRNANKAVASGTALITAGRTFAADDFAAAAKAGIDSAQATGLTVGGYVVAAVAALVVVGLVIGLVRKL